MAEIGFLASWWVGFFCGWFIARITVSAFPRAVAFRHSLSGMLIILVVASAGSIAGYIFGLLHGPDYSGWEEIASYHNIVDVPGFARVAFIHNASYLGGLIGLAVAIIHIRRISHRPKTADEIEPARMP